MDGYPPILVKKRFVDAKLPVRANPTDSGLDVFAYDLLKYYLCNNEEATDDSIEYMRVREIGGFILYPGARALVDTGISATVKEGVEIQIRSRSGLALRQGIVVCNQPGTVDNQYLGPIGVILYNTSGSPQKILIGDKIAQLVVCPVILSDVVVVTELPSTKRGEDGFGSTGR